MKPNPQDTRPTPPLTAQQARKVADRYMQGLTSVAEEQALAQFLKTPAGADAEFDALRAVFAYLDMGRLMHAKASTPVQTTSAKVADTKSTPQRTQDVLSQSQSASHKPLSASHKPQAARHLTLSPRLLKSAAAIAALVVGGWMCWEFLPTLQQRSLDTENMAIAYVGGKPITDAATVDRMLQESLQMVSESEEVDIVQEQLSDMFNTLDEEE
ncbi:MAG: hypothetical protein IIV54_01130 [Bacteroidaceae bacterium]|nr:hypothetical protein [Bacteroidaceae bacterium]